MYRQADPDGYLSSAFAGSFDLAVPAIRNVGLDFAFDDARLRPECKDCGWIGTRRGISGDSVGRRIDGRMPSPGGQHPRPVPKAQLCFLEDADGWRIQGSINGGA